MWVWRVAPVSVLFVRLAWRAKAEFRNCLSERLLVASTSGDKTNSNNCSAIIKRISSLIRLRKSFSAVVAGSGRLAVMAGQ